MLFPLFLGLVALVVSTHPQPEQALQCGHLAHTCSEDGVEAHEEALSRSSELQLLQKQVTVGKVKRQGPLAVDPDVNKVAPAIAAEQAVEDAAAARDLEVEAATQAAWKASPKGPDQAPAAVSKPEVIGDQQEAPKAAVHASIVIHQHSDFRQFAQVLIPAVAIVFGAAQWMAGQRTVGLLAIYFGGQTGFSLYMKIVLSNAYVSEELHLKGVPAGFLVTAIQQIVAVGVLASCISALWFTRWRYVPRSLTNLRELATMLLFSLTFAVNIGLNNMSLSLLSVSLNLIIRSCMPLVCLVVQWMLTSCLPQAAGAKVTFTEVGLMVAGVVFAGVATIAEGEGSQGAEQSKHLVLGVIMCVLSDFAGALNMVLASAFRTHLDPPLNPIDTIWYMAVPCGIFLLPPSFSYQHPVDWPGFERITDWEVLRKVIELSPSTLGLIALSGVIAAAYNILQYTVVQQLSATHATFAGNFNKAATIMLSIILGLETLPQSSWGSIMVLAILGNIGAFTGYSMLKVGGNKDSGHGHRGLAQTEAASSQKL